MHFRAFVIGAFDFTGVNEIRLMDPKPSKLYASSSTRDRTDLSQSEYELDLTRKYSRFINRSESEGAAPEISRFPSLSRHRVLAIVCKLIPFGWQAMVIGRGYLRPLLMGICVDAEFDVFNVFSNKIKGEVDSWNYIVVCLSNAICLS
ncbi:defective in exine formation protein [Striga asiatica]|uniref:Defective in exine formation protein n=1 Tax=Striga asiatica TaxID=4170 RepID=A0A5A7PK27_STRAF|nr:defective in exine formation protein [Striga asiatica]